MTKIISWLKNVVINSEAQLLQMHPYLGIKLPTLLLPTDSKNQYRHGSPPKGTSSVLPVCDDMMIS